VDRHAWHVDDAAGSDSEAAIGLAMSMASAPLTTIARRRRGLRLTRPTGAGLGAGLVRRVGYWSTERLLRVASRFRIRSRIAYRCSWLDIRQVI